VRIATARDVLGVIEGQVAAVLGDGELGTAERARTIATLAGAPFSNARRRSSFSPARTLRLGSFRRCPRR
jgi:hypothetical protein